MIRDGTPTTTGGGTLYIAWRHFSRSRHDPVHKSTNFRNSFSGHDQPAECSVYPSAQKPINPRSTANTTDPAARCVSQSRVSDDRGHETVLSWSRGRSASISSEQRDVPAAEGGRQSADRADALDQRRTDDINGVVGGGPRWTWASAIFRPWRRPRTRIPPHLAIRVRS
jgi:hypothetical protein